MSLPGRGNPGSAQHRLVAAEESGKAAVRLIESGLKPSDIITVKSVENALRVLLSSAARPTPSCIWRRSPAARHSHPMARFQPAVGRNACPGRSEAGRRRLMEDFHAAGGVGALLRELKPLLHLDAIDVEGRRSATVLAEPLDWVGPRVHPARSTIRFRPSAALSRSLARLRRTAPSSSARRRRRPCSNPRGARRVQRAGRSRLRASTIRTSSARRRFSRIAERRPHAAACRKLAICRSEKAGAGRREGHSAGCRMRAFRGTASVRSCCNVAPEAAIGGRSPPCATRPHTACRSRRSVSIFSSKRRDQTTSCRPIVRRLFPRAATRRCIDAR